MSGPWRLSNDMWRVFRFSQGSTPVIGYYAGEDRAPDPVIVQERPETGLTLTAPDQDEMKHRDQCRYTQPEVIGPSQFEPHTYI